MSNLQNKGEIDEKLSDKDVEDFLRANPEFFENHGELLMDLRVPHPNTGSAVSLIEHQVELLRKQNSKIQKQLDELIQIARENDRLSKNMHQLILSLMGTKNLNEALTLLYSNLRTDFSADAVCIRFLAQPKSAKLADNKEFSADVGLMTKHFGRQLKEGKAICGRAKTEQKKILFEEQGGKVKSLAFIPLKFTNSAGFLAIGSYDEKRFHSGMGTLFLNQLGQIVSKTIGRFLKAE
jgi:uncharacterized protein YigA (DUF484 family)